MLKKTKTFFLVQKKWPGFVNFWKDQDLSRKLSKLDCVEDLLTTVFTAEPPSTAGKSRSTTTAVAGSQLAVLNSAGHNFARNNFARHILVKNNDYMVIIVPIDSIFSDKVQCNSYSIILLLPVKLSELMSIFVEWKSTSGNWAELLSKQIVKEAQIPKKIH